MTDSKPTSAPKPLSRRTSLEIPAATNKSAELRAKAAASKAAKTVAEKKQKEAELESNKKERLEHAKKIIADRKSEHAANTTAKAVISKAAPAKWKAQSVVAQAVKEGAELAQSIKPIDANSVNVKAPTETKSLALRKSVGNVKAAETNKVKQAEGERGALLKQERLNKAKEIIANRKSEHAANTTAKAVISKAAPAKWKSESVVAKAVKEGAELAASIKPIDANTVNVKAPKATKSQALRESVGNVKAAATMKIKHAEQERLAANKAEEMNRAKEIIATRKAEHEQNKRVEPVVSEAKPLNWKSESVVAQAVKEGAELAQNIRPIRNSSNPSSRRATLDKDGLVLPAGTSRRASGRVSMKKDEQVVPAIAELQPHAVSAKTTVLEVTEEAPHQHTNGVDEVTAGMNGLKMTSEQAEAKEASDEQKEQVE